MRGRALRLRGEGDPPARRRARALARKRTQACLPAIRRRAAGDGRRRGIRAEAEPPGPEGKRDCRHCGGGSSRPSPSPSPWLAGLVTASESGLRPERPGGLGQLFRCAIIRVRAPARATVAAADAPGHGWLEQGNTERAKRSVHIASSRRSGTKPSPACQSTVAPASLSATGGSSSHRSGPEPAGGSGLSIMMSWVPSES